MYLMPGVVSKCQICPQRHACKPAHDAVLNLRHFLLNHLRQLPAKPIFYFVEFLLHFCPDSTQDASLRLFHKIHHLLPQ
ncbi:hypothetical protein FJTKL_10897 [Diaporthe vaccinii]|uniref:Uncharacterized protein n=1 Tax=Diaporthe vaccinii TaxID=105482 RepID=A0ABR4EIK2_9PEZI